MIFLRRYKTYIKQYEFAGKTVSHIPASYKTNINHTTIIDIRISTMFNDIVIQSQYMNEYFACGNLYRCDIICSHAEILVISGLVFSSSEYIHRGNYRYTQERMDLYGKLSKKKKLICNIKADIPESVLEQIMEELCDWGFINVYRVPANVYINNKHRKTIKFAESS